MVIEVIEAEIAASGPMPLPRYMELCNAHYYTTRDPFGEAGDFTTAPEISQLFGELLGLWAVNEWERLGSPARFTLLELGPGRGTLMCDALRAARVRPGFLAAMDLQLCETSPILRAKQAETLTDYRPHWRETLDNLPAQPLIVIANEFFDALPVAQVRRLNTGWQQRCVTLQESQLAWTETPIASDKVPIDLQAVPANVWVEHSPVTRALMRQLCGHLATHGGSACIVDYGTRVDPARLSNGDTLQALHRHRMADPLQTPGEADLTCHVDFAPLLAIAQSIVKPASLQAGYGTQAQFLTMLGIADRAARLDLQAEAARLVATSTGSGQMGSLFKVLTVQSQGTGR